MINFMKYNFFSIDILFSLIQTISATVEQRCMLQLQAANGSIANVHNDYERSDIALGDVKKQNNVNADYGVLPVNDGYTTLPSSSDGYGVMPTSSN